MQLYIHCEFLSVLASASQPHSIIPGNPQVIATASSAPPPATPTITVPPPPAQETTRPPPPRPAMQTRFPLPPPPPPPLATRFPTPSDLVILQNQSASRRNFAKRLPEVIYSKDERRSNVNGRAGKEKLSPNKMEELKAAVLN